VADDPRLVRNDTLRTFFTPLAILISAAGVAYSVWHGDQTQQRQKIYDFQLQAAQIVMAEPTCLKQLEKAAQLRTLFPGQLPPNFGKPIILAVHPLTPAKSACPPS
jgi:hypothetical protein